MLLEVHGRTAYAYTGGRPFDPALPCVVFVHGAGDDHSGWTLLARWFAHHGWAVLAPDLPGHMRSAGPLRADVEAHADWLLALLDAAGARQAALVGHSMGSLIALEAAARAPARASRLVMVGTAYPMKVGEALLAAVRADPPAAMKMVTTWSYASLAAKPGYPGPGAWLHGGGLALKRRVQAAARGVNVFAHGFEVCHRYAGGLAAAARVTCPVAFVLGAADRMTPPHAARDLATALHARVATLPGGHYPHAESPDAALAAVRAALA